MLETNDDATLEKRQVEEVSSREREKGQPVDESEVDEVALIKEANESEASERNEEPDEKIAYFLRGKGLSENLVKTLINADLTDEYVRLLKALNFDDVDIEALRDLWRIKIEIGKSGDSSDSATSGDSSSDVRLSPDNLYLKTVLSKPLIEALREIVAKKPTDPVEYLGHRLLHFKVCEERSIRRKEKALELLINREKLKKVVSEESLPPVERKKEETPGEDWDYPDYGE